LKRPKQIGSEDYREWKSKRRRLAREPNKVKVSIVSITKASCSQGFKLGDTSIIEANFEKWR
jgi:hypothetical protein